MSGSHQTSKASGKKRKHQDEDATASRAVKKSKIERTLPQGDRDETSYKERKHAAESSSHKSSNSNRRRNKRIRELSEREKAPKPIDDSAKSSSTRKVTKNKYRDRRKRRKDYREEEDGASKSNENPAVKQLLGTSTEGGKEPKTDHEARRQRKALKKAMKANANAQDGTSMALLRQGEPHEKNVARGHASPSWTVSTPTAGRFLRHDPNFVSSEDGAEFLISANSRELRLLSLETSLIVRTCPAPNDGRIACFSMHALNPNKVLIAYENGSIDEWDWTEDSKNRASSSAKNQVVAMDSVPDTTGSRSWLFYVSVSKSEHRIFKLGRKLPFYSTSQQLSSISVLGNGEYIVCFGPSALVIGKRKDKDDSDDDYVFVEISLSITATSCDARLMHNDKKGKGQPPDLRLVLGHRNGQIHLYENLSSLFLEFRPQHRSEQPTSRGLPSPRILHWHREAVSSVKFSRDGNYLISGGRETVLVIWQLETGKKQFLPHLTSEIERIVVNPAGDRYAVQMGDNSIMVLSTSELKPVALFAGLQMIQSPSKAKHEEQVADRKSVAAVLHPKQPSQLLVTVPSSAPQSLDEIWSRPFLQTFDTRYSRHVSRQALTRNNVTDFNLGPERTPILPPDVIHLAISHDGAWLATVDEWMPPASDLEHLDADDEAIERERERRREVYLKIWHWNEQEGIWTLSTRADAPHARANGDAVGAGTVLALEIDPTSNAFATIGEDSCVKFWRPRKRKVDADVVDWRCTWSLQIPRTSDTEADDGFGDTSERDEQREASMAFSGDGSLLAVSMSQSGSSDFVDQQMPMVHFIDTFSGIIAAAKSNLAKTAIRALGFLGRHFIAVTLPAVYLWDLVEETLVYKAELSPIVPGEPPSEMRRPLLAVNSEDNTIAIVVDGRRVEVYGVKQSTRLFKQDFEVAVGAVLSAAGRRGFVLLFEDATIRTMTPSGASSQSASLANGFASSLALPTPEASSSQPLALDQVTGEDDELPNLSTSSTRLLKDADATATMHAQAMEEDDRPVVRPEQLANIFDVPHSFAMPPVKDMFSAVVGLFGRKPLQTVQS